MKNMKNLIIMVLLAVLLVFLLNPSWNIFLSEGTRNAVQSEIQSVFGILAGGPAVGIFSPAKLLTAAAVLVFMTLATMLVCAILERVSAKKRRTQTVAGLLTSVVKGVGAIITLVWVLSVLGVDLAAIVASLGVVSLILGFGVQSLIEDCVTGIFIILENEFNVGDIIILGDFRGTVRRISMRTTAIEDDGGNLKIINNSDIRDVQNRTHATSWALANISISYDANIPQVEAILKKELPKIYHRNPELFVSEPAYSGVQALGPSSVDLRVRAEVEEGKIYAAQRCLNRELKLILDHYGIEIPFPQVVVHNAK